MGWAHLSAAATGWLAGWLDGWPAGRLAPRLELGGPSGADWWSGWRGAANYVSSVVALGPQNKHALALEPSLVWLARAPRRRPRLATGDWRRARRDALIFQSGAKLVRPLGRSGRQSALRGESGRRVGVRARADGERSRRFAALQNCFGPPLGSLPSSRLGRPLRVGERSQCKGRWKGRARPHN